MCPILVGIGRVTSYRLPPGYILYGRRVKSSTDATVGEEEAPEVQLRRTIGRAAREARTQLRLTQAEVAEALGMAPEVYGRIERGEFMPSVPTLVSVATVLRVAPDQLLGWTELQARGRSVEYERILSLLDRAEDASLKKAEAILRALFAPASEK
jgi:transcriptional regulator with XRE-family HTH domain